MEAIKSSDKSPKSKKQYQTWSKKLSKNDITEEITVTEAENGYLVTHCK